MTDRYEKGFSLLEVLVALLIFSVAALWFLSLQSKLALMSTNARYQADASYILTNQTELLASFNDEQRFSYIQMLRRLSAAAQASNQPLKTYQQAAHALPINCQQSTCDAQLYGQAAAVAIAQQAADRQLLVLVTSCQGEPCFEIRWGLSLKNPNQPCEHQGTRPNCIRMGYKP